MGIGRKQRYHSLLLQHPREMFLAAHSPTLPLQTEGVTLTSPLMTNLRPVGIVDTPKMRETRRRTKLSPVAREA